MSVFAGRVSWCGASSSVLGSLFLVLGSVLCSVFSVLGQLLSCSLPAQGSPEQPWNSSWSREVLPGLLRHPRWDSSPSVMLFSLSGNSWVVFSSSFQQAGLSFQVKPGSALQNLRIQAKHSGMQNSWSWEQGGRDAPQVWSSVPAPSWASLSARSRNKEAPASHRKILNWDIY